MLAVILIVLALAGTGAYFYVARTVKEKPASAVETPKKEQKTADEAKADDIASWKTYQNKKCGYEIKYPQNYQVEENASFVHILNSAGGGNFIYCVLASDFLKGAYSLQEYIKQGVKDHSISANFQPKSINVGNLTGTEVEGFGAAGSYKDIYLQKGDYILQFNIEKEANETGIKIFGQMLTTFKFIEPPAGVTKTEILPRTAKDLEGQAEKVQLADGMVCFFMGGATGVNAKNERMNYNCGNVKLSIVIYGDLMEGDVWKANVSDVEYDAAKKIWKIFSVKTVDIAKIWR